MSRRGNTKNKYALYQRGKKGTWWVATLRVSTHTSDPETARQRRDFIVREHEAGRWETRQRADRYTFDDLAERFFADRVFESEGTHAFYRDRLKPLTAYFKGYTLLQLDSVAIDTYMRHRRSQKAANGTIAGELTLLGLFFKKAIRLRWATANPVREVERPSIKKRGNGNPLSETDEAQLLEYCRNSDAMGGNLHDIVIMGIYTGQRRGSLLSRCWEHVDFNRKSIVCRNDKTDTDYVIPLAAPVLAMLQRRWHEGATGLIFATSTGSPYIPHNLWRDMTAACKAAGIGHRKPHDLRHTCGTRLAELGFAAHQIAAILDHTSTEVTLGYIKHSLLSKEKMMESFGKKSAEIEANTCTIPAQLCTN